MFKAIILPLAKKDIKEVAHWYNSNQTGLGKRFTAQVRKKVKLKEFMRQLLFCFVARFQSEHCQTVETTIKCL